MAPSRVKGRKKDARPQVSVVKPQNREVKVCTLFTQVVALQALFRVAVLFWFFNLGCLHISLGGRLYLNFC
jgi:hypothetical protein